MKIAALTMSIILLSSIALSQIQITSSDVQGIYATGKSWRHLENSKFNATLNIGTASSTAQTWTFPTIAYTDTAIMDNVRPLSTPYAASFPRATHAQRARISSGGSTSTFYQYLRVTTDSLIELGDALRLQGSGTDTTEYDFYTHAFMLFPFTYGKSTSYQDSISIFAGSYILEQTTNTCDAFGTLSIPSGTFQALRMKQTSISRTIYGGVPYSTDTSVSFTWITKDGNFVDVSPSANNPGGGSILVSSISYISVITTPTGIATGGMLPPTPLLSQNYPNPFNPSTAIEYVLPTDGRVRLTVHNALGEEIKSLVNGFQTAGIHRVTFDAAGLPSGVYFYRLMAGGRVSVGKMSLLK